jgi:hypothetical protein
MSFTPSPPGSDKNIGVHCWADTVAALEAYALAHDITPSGAAHVLLREALGLPPITPNTPN